MRRSELLTSLRSEAWARGRQARDNLLSEYCRRYKLAEPPPPALIADEIITDILRATLVYDALELHVFAETECVDGALVVTINNRIREMPGVIDYTGIENVAKWHEIDHILEDGPTLKAQRPLALPGFGGGGRIVCFRSDETARSSADWKREFGAEEAGRAAAVSYVALARSAAFRHFASKSGRVPGNVGWPLLQQAAKDIHVNRTALAKQLQLEGRIVVQEEDGRQVLYVQRGLAEYVEEP